MLRSEGRLSSFSPVADDDGIDLLVYDRQTGRALPARVKSRTTAIKKRGTETRGNTIIFDVRKATLRSDRHACCLLVLLTNDMTQIERSWVIPMRELRSLAADRPTKYVIRASKAVESRDEFSRFRCRDAETLVTRVLGLLEQSPRPVSR